MAIQFGALVVGLFPIRKPPKKRNVFGLVVTYPQCVGWNIQNGCQPILNWRRVFIFNQALLATADGMAFDSPTGQPIRIQQNAFDTYFHRLSYCNIGDLVTHSIWINSSGAQRLNWAECRSTGCDDESDDSWCKCLLDYRTIPLTGSNPAQDSRQMLPANNKRIAIFLDCAVASNLIRIYPQSFVSGIFTQSFFVEDNRYSRIHYRYVGNIVQAEWHYSWAPLSSGAVTELFRV